ncbi:MAG: amino acid ABC transporter permease [Acetobacteraceae bacterium]|nr:amino acid ABC transporter permease [Acetobacteraceae bacterium]
MNWPTFNLLLEGAAVTAGLSAVSVLCGLALGIVICGASLAQARVLRSFASAYVSFFRGVPLLVQLLLLYHALPRLGLDLPGIAAAAVGLTLCTAAYQAENLRGGFLNVPPGLIEAGRMVGMNARQVMTRIRTPIALRLTLPSVVNEAILILKASSLVSVVGVADLTRTAQNIASSNYRPVETFATAGALYLVLNVAVAGGGDALGRILGRGR